MGALLLAPLLLLPCFGFSNLILEPCSFIYFFIVVSAYWPEAKWSKERQHFPSSPGQKRTPATTSEFWIVRQASERSEDPGPYLFRISSPVSAEPPLLEA